jgi:hypothetical protein
MNLIAQNILQTSSSASSSRSSASNTSEHITFSSKQNSNEMSKKDHLRSSSNACATLIKTLIQSITLKSLIFTFMIFILQVYLIINRCKSLSDFNQSITANQIKSSNSILVNGLMIAVSFCLNLVYLLLNMIKIGVYSHDSFKLGQNFDKSRAKRIEISNNQQKINILTPLSMSSSIETQTDASSSTFSRKPLTQASSKPLSKWSFSVQLKCPRIRFRNIQFKLPPFGALIHLSCALILLLTELHLTSKRIQLGFKPVGDIFATKLDFLLGDPIDRLKQLQSLKFELEQQQLNKIASLSASSFDLTMNDLINSKDDFSAFSSSIDLDKTLPSESLTKTTTLFYSTSTSTTISLDYLNLIIASFVFSVKISQTFWFASKTFSLLLAFYYINVSILMLTSYCALEILFKANNLHSIAKNFLLFTATKLVSLNQANKTLNSNSVEFIDDYLHDLIAIFLFITSFLILNINGYFMVLFGFRKFEKVKAKFETNVCKYFTYNFLNNNHRYCPYFDSTSNLTFNKHETGVDSQVSAKRLKTSNDEIKETLNVSNKESRGSECLDKVSKNLSESLSRIFSCSNLLQETLTSICLFVFYCTLRVLFLLELFILFKYSHDVFFVISGVFELAPLLLWIFQFLLFVAKFEWNFTIVSAYKHEYWNWIYSYWNVKLFSSRNHTLSYSISPNTLNEQNEKLLPIANEPALANSNEQIPTQQSVKYEQKQEQQPQEPTNMCTDRNSNNKSQTSSKIANGLLVRDDSILLNHSANLSSSSITDVSSLIPTTSSFNGSHVNKSTIQRANKSQRSLSDYYQFRPMTKPINTSKEDDSEEVEANYQKVKLEQASPDTTYEMNGGFFYNNELLFRNTPSELEREAYLQNGEKSDDSNYLQVKMSTQLKNMKDLLDQVRQVNKEGSHSYLNSAMSTIGEIMETTSELKQTGSGRTSTKYKNIISKKTQKSANNNDYSSSSAITADSGRDSCVESPIDHSLSTTSSFATNSGLKRNSVHRNSCVLTTKPYLIASSPSAVLLEPSSNINVNHCEQSQIQTISLIKPSQLFDSKC